MNADDRSLAIVQSAIDLAHSLGLRMVAEGVEDELTARQLCDAGCDEAQGFYFSRALPVGEFESWLAPARGRARPGGRNLGVGA